MLVVIVLFLNHTKNDMLADVCKNISSAIGELNF